MPHKKSRKVRRGKKTGRKTMKMKRGGYYGFGQSSPVAPGAASVTKGSEMPDAKAAYGGKRSRRSRTRRGRKMRGGMGGWSVVKAASFNGESAGNGNAVYTPVIRGGPNDVISTE